jgi:hypothetical protein
MWIVILLFCGSIIYFVQKIKLQKIYILGTTSFQIKRNEPLEIFTGIINKIEEKRNKVPLLKIIEF